MLNHFCVLMYSNRNGSALPCENPIQVRIHDIYIVLEMIGCIVEVYSGKTFNWVQIKLEKIYHYFDEFSISYKFVKHWRLSIIAPTLIIYIEFCTISICFSVLFSYKMSALVRTNNLKSTMYIRSPYHVKGY